jgi:hypothetical protein
MNERIKLLADQAGLHDFVLIAMGIDEELEKFAELLVLECASIADTAEPFLSSDLIKQHFGVEE